MTASQLHRAAILSAPKARHDLQMRPTPTPAADEVLVKITATAINPVDWKIQGGNGFISSYPAVLGYDAAGEVAAAGKEVTNVSVGDRVFFQGILANYDASTFQQYCTMPAALVGKTPPNISDDAAAGISLATVAAVTGMYDGTGYGLSAPWDVRGDVAGKGKAVVVLGGSSSVGQYAIQFARLSGFDRIIAGSSASHAEFLKSLGATVVLDRSKATAEDYFEAAKGLGFDFVFDSISVKDTQILGTEILRLSGGGTLVTVQASDGEAVKLSQSDEGKPVQIKPIAGLGSKPELRYLSEPVMKLLGGDDGWLAKNKVIPNRTEVVPGGLEALEEALQRNKKGVSGVKVVIRPQE